MRKISYLILLVSLTASLAACKKEKAIDTDEQYTQDTTAIRKFIVANNIAAIKEPKSGIFYQIIAPGTGTFAYTDTTKVTVNYTGRLLNGSIFDSSKGTPVAFNLSRLIEGWQIGIPLIQKEGSIRLLIPSYYGYGNVNQGSIPANSVLDFTIDLKDLAK